MLLGYDNSSYVIFPADSTREADGCFLAFKMNCGPEAIMSIFIGVRLVFCLGGCGHGCEQEEFVVQLLDSVYFTFNSLVYERPGEDTRLSIGHSPAFLLMGLSWYSLSYTQQTYPTASRGEVVCVWKA